MKTNPKVLKGIFFSVIAILPMICGEYAHYQRTHFSCDSEFFAQSSNEKIKIIVTYHFSNGTGNYNAMGHSVSTENVVTPINRHFPFNYYHENGRILFISSEDEDNPKGPGEADTFVPDFFRFSDRGINVRSIKENSTGYLISLGDTPMLYCKRLTN